MAKKKTQEEVLWEEEIEEKPKKKSGGARNKRKGNSYELKLIKELKEITGDVDLCSSRSESKRLDDAKIDIADPNGILDFYVQAKSTMNVPQIKKINDEVGKKDKPLIIFWNAQEKREVNFVSVGEYCIVPKSYFYDLLKIKYEK